MKSHRNWTCPVLLMLSLVALESKAGDRPRLTLSEANSNLQLSWPATSQKADGSVVRPYFELQRTLDLQRWQPIGERQRAAITAPGQTLNRTLALDVPHAFYRLLSIEPSAVAKLGSGGAEVFGYGDAFAEELKRIGQISPDQFGAMCPPAASKVSLRRCGLRVTWFRARCNRFAGHPISVQETKPMKNRKT